jgi:radical SAM protein with 4Fe4S-binding SPASM domain
MPDRPWGSNFSQHEIDEARRGGLLLSLELELSRKCDLNCIYCYADSGEQKQGELSLKEIYDVLRQASAAGVRRIIVLGGGEPLVYPHTMDIMRSIADLGMGIDLFTNGTHLTPDMARQFIELGVAPVVKMNSMIPDVQDRLAGKRGAHASIRQGLDALMQAGYPTANLPLGAQSIICRQNLEELPHMWVWLRDRNIIPYFEMITLQGRARKHPELAVTVEEAQALFETLARIDRERYGLHWEPHPSVAGLCCNRHAYSCTVTVEGNILPCPGVDIPVGNIRRTPLLDIVRGSTVLHELRNVRQYIKGECRDCDLSHECYGCRGMAYQATGDYLAPDPLCWRPAMQKHARKEAE